MDRDAIARLHRRAGWGLGPGELDAAAADGLTATIDRLVDPDGHGVPVADDPWAGVDLTPVPPPGPDASPTEKQAARRDARAQSEAAISAWLDHLVTTPRPFEDWMAWFWHGHFVSGLDKVKSAPLMVQQLRTYRSLAFAPFPALVRAATTDPAMLLYLDGATSTGTQPNENYSRELLELFTIGIGNYTEADVQAGARALTGWTVQRRTGTAAFGPRRHDDAPQQYLGTAGVHDVDGVVAAATGHPACASFVAGTLARTIIGPDVEDALVEDLGRQFRASGLDTRTLARAVLEAAASRPNVATVVPPVPWVVAAQRATGATIDARDRIRNLRAAGQVPMLPPSVAGWPIGTAWFGASTIVAKYALATQIAAAAPAGSPALTAAQSFDLDALADALACTSGFGSATRDAFASVRRDPHAVLALALVSSELAVA
jgi:uncharacterized protein (DUF1800 family)